MATSSKALDDKHSKIIKQLLTETENKKCMDCGLKVCFLLVVAQPNPYNDTWVGREPSQALIM